MFLYSMINKLCNYICSRQIKGKCMCLSYICIKQVYQNVTGVCLSHSNSFILLGEFFVFVENHISRISITIYIT